MSDKIELVSLPTLSSERFLGIVMRACSKTSSYGYYQLRFELSIVMLDTIKLEKNGKRLMCVSMYE